MSGTKNGGIKCRNTNYERHGKDFYKEIGRKGGKKSHTGGFASNKIGDDGVTGKERAKIAGMKGGKVSKRGHSYEKLWNLQKENVIEALSNGYSIKDISEAIGIPYGSLIKRIKGV